MTCDWGAAQWVLAGWLTFCFGLRTAFWRARRARSPDKAWPEFIGEEIGGHLNTVFVGVTLYWGGFWS